MGQRRSSQPSGSETIPPEASATPTEWADAAPPEASATPTEWAEAAPPEASATPTESGADSSDPECCDEAEAVVETVSL